MRFGSLFNTERRNGEEVKKRNLSKALYTESVKSIENGWKENEKREVD